MKTVVIFFALGVLYFTDASICSNRDAHFYRNLRYDAPCEREALVSYVNALNTTWRAGHNSRFRHTSHSTVHKMMGVNLIAHEQSLQHVRLGKSRHLDMAIPREFDSRKEWSKCKSVHEVGAHWLGGER